MSATSAPRSRRPTQAFAPNESATVPRDASLLHRSTKPAAPSKRLVHFRAFGQQLHAWLVQRVHASTLCTWRVLFAICMYRQALNFGDMFDEFQRSVAVFPYPALGWVTPVEPAVGNALLAINRWAAVLVGLGLLTRPSSLVLFATFTYLFLLCQSNHNNHYILICHVSRTLTLICFINILICHVSRTLTRTLICFINILICHVSRTLTQKEDPFLPYVAAALTLCFPISQHLIQPNISL